MRKSNLYHKWVECEVIEDVIHHFEAEGRSLPSPCIRPMQEVA